MSAWTDFTKTAQEREQALIEAVPFWVVRNRKVECVDLYESRLFWIEDEGLASFHFRGLEGLESSNALIVYTTEQKAHTAWQKEMRHFYEMNYTYYQNMVSYLDDFREENLEMFV